MSKLNPLLDNLPDDDDDATCLLPQNIAVNLLIPDIKKPPLIVESPAHTSPFKEEDSTNLISGQKQPKNTVTSAQPINDDKTNKVSFENDFSIQGIIGEGGVGRVYLAEDKSIGRRVAVKELLDTSQHNLSKENKQALENSFIHEAKITAKLEHPGIIPVYKLGHRQNKSPYYVMRHIKGETLEELLKKCQLSSIATAAQERLKLLDNLIATCDAIAYAHSKGVVHRDLKPGNIMIGKFGETIVLDWGLAQAIDDGDNTYFFKDIQRHQTDTYSDITTHNSMGTPRYMSPEQLKGHATKASDVYSLGVILFKIITGDLPYKGSLQQIQEQLLSDKPSPSPNHYIETLSPELGAICEKAIAKNSNDRFADAGQLSQQLKDYRDGRMVNIYSYSKKELFRRFLAKNKFIVLIMLSLLVAIIAGGAFSVHYAMEMDQARKKAEDALISVTALGEYAQKQATNITHIFSKGIEDLFSDMQSTANQLNAFTRKNIEAENKLLSILHRQYPKFISFTIENSEAIPATLGWKAGGHKFNAPIAHIENERLILSFLVPLKRQGKDTLYLVAKVLPEIVIPSFFPIEVDSKHPKDIWVMQDDGLIVYDAEIKYQATNIFIDTANAQSTSFIAFSKQTLEKPFGISYYSVIKEGKKIFKIAAWHTIDFPQAKSWKMIVNYTYMSSHSH